MSQRVGDQEGVIHPSHGCPVSPLTPRGAAHELWISGQNPGCKDTNPTTERAAAPSPGHGASRDPAGSPKSIFSDKIRVVHRAPEPIRSCFPAFPLPQDCSSTHPMGCMKHQLLWEVSYNIFGLDHVPSHPLPLTALGCSKTLFEWPKIMNKMAWRTWNWRKCQIMVVYYWSTTLLPEEFLKNKNLHFTLAPGLALQQPFPYFSCFFSEAVIPW